MMMNSIEKIRKASLLFKSFIPVCTSPSQQFSSSSRLSTMTSSDHFTVAVCQLQCTSDRKKNFETCKSFIHAAASNQAQMVFLPECFDHVGESKKQSIELSEPLDGRLISDYRQLAAEKSIWLSLGGFHEKDPTRNEERVFNSHIIINSKGDIVSVYRKVHLFEIDILGVRLRESDFSIPGTAIIPPVQTPVGKVGLGICYDLRFPEFALSLTKAGAQILTYPSAFTQTTGMAHWEPLLRSRAIETQSYVIAAAQTGKHNPKRASYGHAMIVDPWGCVVACCSEGEGIAFAEIKSDMITRIRTEMPVWMHRREELYGSILSADSENRNSRTEYKFGSIELHPDMIFYKTKSSMAFVNKKPILPGHVLVTPYRIAERLADLSAGEIADLFSCVQTVQKQIEAVHGATSSTIAIQDGPDAGQTIPHIHVHIVPRKGGDFEKNDDIYQELHDHDKVKNDKWRTNEDMIAEASILKKHF